MCNSHLESTQSLNQADALDDVKVITLTAEVLDKKNNKIGFNDVDCNGVSGMSAHHRIIVFFSPHALFLAAPGQCLLVPHLGPGQPPQRM